MCEREKEGKRRAESVYILANWPVAHSHPLWKDCGCCPHLLSSILHCQCVWGNIRMLLWSCTGTYRCFTIQLPFRLGLYACTDWDTVPGNVICEFVTPKTPQVTLFSSLTEHVGMGTWTPIQDLDHIHDVTQVIWSWSKCQIWVNTCLILFHNRLHSSGTSSPICESPNFCFRLSDRFSSVFWVDVVTESEGRTALILSGVWFHSAETH